MGNKFPDFFTIDRYDEHKINQKGGTIMRIKISQINFGFILILIFCFSCSQQPEPEPVTQEPQNNPKKLNLSGKSCLPNHYVRGFDEEGNILCTVLPLSVFPKVSRNSDWTPLVQEFNGALMALVPAGCLEERCFNVPFWIDVYEVTNEQYGESGRFTGAQRPRELVTWYEAQAFCETRGARLPDEWEWEYAARGPDLLEYPWGNSFESDNVVRLYNNCNNGEQDGPCDVGSRPGNISWVGAYDMSGNIYEWTSSDRGPTNKVLRGGSWVNYDELVSASFRFSDDPSFMFSHYGFRCVRSY